MQTAVVAGATQFDTREIDHARSTLWLRLIEHGLNPKLPPELLIAEVYEMLTSEALSALTPRKQKLALVITSVARRISRFHTALTGNNRFADYGRAVKNAADKDPEHWKWLKEQEKAFRAGLSDAGTEPVTKAIAEYTRRSRYLVNRLEEYRDVLHRKNKAFKRAGYDAKVDLYERENGLVNWLQGQITYAASEVEWYLVHLRGSRGKEFTGDDGPLTIARWREMRDESISALEDAGASRKEVQHFFPSLAPVSKDAQLAAEQRRGRTKKRIQRAKQRIRKRDKI
jgi:hypothetical protein